MSIDSAVPDHQLENFQKGNIQHNYKNQFPISFLNTLILLGTKKFWLSGRNLSPVPKLPSILRHTEDIVTYKYYGLKNAKNGKIFQRRDDVTWEDVVKNANRQSPQGVYVFACTRTCVRVCVCAVCVCVCVCCFLLKF